MARREGGIGYGSGYQIGAHLVLTAGHVTDSAGAISVRFGCRPDPTEKVPARVVWRGTATDLALLWLDWADDAPPWPVAVPALGYLSAVSAHRVAFTAAGFPAHKQQRRPDGGILRDSDQVDGEILTAANLKTALLDLHRNGRLLTLGPAWKGISGAAVFARGLLVGTIVQAEARDTPLIAEPLAVAMGGFSPAVAERQEPAEQIEAFHRQLEGGGVPAGLLPVRREPVYSRVLVEVAARCKRLVGREDELSHLAAFVSSTQGYAWWRAPPWAGKTALAAYFATHPPAHVDVVAFFVSRALGQQTSQCLRHLCDQLAALLDEEPPSVSDHAAFQDLWARGAKQAVLAQRRLLLLVDGLDENNTSPPIAALLPGGDLPAAQVLVFSRLAPGIPTEVHQNHPLRDSKRCPRVRLEPSRLGRELESLARSDLEAYLIDPDKTPRRVLGLLAACGPLAIEEMTALFELEGVDVDGLDVRRVVDQAAARVLERHQTGADDGPGEWRYAFAHETLQTVAIKDIGRKLIAAHEDAVRRWAGQHVAANWPDDTPQYLLDGYPAFLDRTRDIGRLKVLPSPRRFRLLRARTGDDGAALEEISLAFTHLKTARPDVGAASVLAIHRYRLLQPLGNYPGNIALGWAAAGFWTRAEHLARHASDLGRAALLVGLAETAAAAGQQTRAVTLSDAAREAATPTPLPDLSAGVMGAASEDISERDTLHLARAAAAAGRWHEAEAALGQIHNPTMWIHTIAYIIRAAGRARDQDRAARWHNLAEQGIVRFGPLAQQELLASLAKAAARAGLWELAEADGRSAGRYQAEVLTEVARTAAAAREWEHAETAARLIDASLARAIALTMVAEAEAAAGERARAASLFDDFESQPPTEEAVPLAMRARMAKAAGRGSQASMLLDQAQTAAAHVDDIVSRAYALTELAGAAAVSGEQALAAKLCAAATDAARQISDEGSRWSIVPLIAETAAATGLWALGKAISGEAGYTESFHLLLHKAAWNAARLEKWELAEAAAREIDDPRRQAAALADIASEAAAAGQRSRAVSLLNSAEDAARQAKAADWPVSLQTEASVAELVMNARRLEEAEIIARRINDPESLVLTLVDVARAAAMTQQWEQAESIAERMDDPAEQARAFSQMAGAAAAAGRWERAEATARRIGDPYWRSWALSKAASAAAAAGHWEHAGAITREVDDSDQRAEALASIAKAAAEAGRWNQAETTTNQIDDPEQRAKALASIAKAAAEAGRWEQAETTARQIRDPDSRSRALDKAATAAAAAGQWKQARAMAHQIDNLYQRAETLASIAKAAAEAGRWNQAETTTNQIDDTRQRAETLASIAKAAAEAEHWERAQSIARQISAPGEREEAFTEVAKVAAAAGQWNQAEAITHQIEDPHRRAKTLASIAKAAATAGRAQADALLDAADQTARQLIALSQRVDALAAVAEVAVLAGQPARAVALLDVGRQAASQETGTEQRFIDHQRLATTSAVAGRWEQAESIADQLGDPRFRAIAFAALAEMALRTGELEQGRRMAAAASSQVRLLRSTVHWGSAVSYVVRTLIKVDPKMAARMVVDALADGSDPILYEAAVTLDPEIVSDLINAFWPQL